MVPTLGIIGLGPGELIFFSVIVLLLFGSRLPSVMRSLGQSVTSFKTGLNEEEKPTESLDEKKNDDKK
jgi:sec-independent protein translocase protein TatA